MNQEVAVATDFSFVHFTDTHIMAGGAFDPNRFDTTASLRRVIEVLNVLEPQPAFAIIGGLLIVAGIFFALTVGESVTAET